MNANGQTRYPVVAPEGAGWVNVGTGFRQPRGGGWNLEFPEGIPRSPIVLTDHRDYGAGEKLRVFVTRPGVRGGTDWFEVGSAKVTRGGRSVVLALDTVVPSDVKRLVVLPPRR